jgi:hypothetical protein
MKKGLLLLLCLGLTVVLQSQTKNVISTAGNLSSILKLFGNNTYTRLIINGTIDARDFRYLRDSSFSIDTIDMGAAKISKYTGDKGTIDYSVSTYDSNAVPENAFNGRFIGTSLVFPTSATLIGNSAFSSCYNITDTLKIPAGISYIGDYAFNSCSGFKGSLVIPNGVKSIGVGVFQQCIGLSGSLVIPSSITHIGLSAFVGCTGLNGSLMLEATVQNIGDSAFMRCSFTDVTIKSPLTRLGSNLFSMSTIKHIVLPNSLDTIGSSAFYGTNIDSVTIPASVKVIDTYAFAECASLKQITVLNPVPVSGSPMGYDVFLNVSTSSCLLFVPAGSKSAYKTADQWKDFTILEGTAALYLPSTVKDTIVLSRSGKQTFAIKAKGAWHASSNQPWLSVSPTDGNGNDSITVTATNLKSSTIRNATINISSAGQPTLKVFFAQDSVATAINTINNIDAIYPNPATTTLHCNAAMGSLVHIYSIEGTELIIQQISADGSIAIDALPNGLYYIETQNNNKQTIVRKFAKQ